MRKGLLEALPSHGCLACVASEGPCLWELFHDRKGVRTCAKLRVGTEITSHISEGRGSLVSQGTWWNKPALTLFQSGLSALRYF